MSEANKLPRTERNRVNEVERTPDAMDARKEAGRMFTTEYDDWSQEDKERIFEKVTEDIRHEDFMYGCYECGICVAACPSARFYDFSPRRIAQAVGREDVDLFFEQLNEDAWDCSQCFSCNRCPRENSPGGLITIMREVAVTENLESAEDALEGYERVIYKIMSTGTQVSPDMIQPEAFPDWGPSAREESEHMDEWRKAIPPETLHTTDTAWTVSDRTIAEMFMIWYETDVLDMLEEIDPGIHMILTDMMDEKMEEGGWAEED
jgi:heterodisulfide reductase subunit C